MGTQHNTVIEINGQKYDARTGKLIASKNTPLKSAHISTDGMSRSAHHAKDMHSKTAKSKTLMRHAVKKPATVSKVTSDGIQGTKKSIAPGSHNRIQKTSIYHNDSERLKRAQIIKQNNLVRKFSDIGAGKPASAAMRAQGVTRPQAVTRPLNVQSVPSHEVHTSSKKSNSIIEHGLRNAQSHNQPRHRIKKAKKAGRLASLAAASLAVFLLVGFFGYQYAPNLSMRYAAARSGVNANMPGYTPSGFALNHHIQYTPGQITLTFRSNSDDRQFNIVQRESKWNSDSLHSNYVANKDKSAQRYEDKGVTVYIYEGSNATWVSGGVWYDIQGNSQLNSDQLIRIASSM